MDKLMKPQKKILRKINRRERGQSLTELALSFMVIAFLLSGAIDLGRAFFVFISLRDAAQEGAIYASMDPNNRDGIFARIQDSSSGPVNFKNNPRLFWDTIINDLDCSGFYDDAGATKANSVEVFVEYEFPITMALIQGITQAITGKDSITLRASSTYAILYPPCHDY